MHAQAAKLLRYVLTACSTARPQRAAGKATEAPGRRFSKLLRIFKEDPGHGAQLIGSSSAAAAAPAADRCTDL